MAYLNDGVLQTREQRCTKNPRFKNYIYWGTTVLAVVACSVTFGSFLSRFETVSKAVGKIVSILMPTIYGAVLAYLMLPIYNKTRAYMVEKPGRCIKDGRTVDSPAKAAGTLVNLLLFIAIVCGLFWMVIPQIYTSIIGLQESLGESINSLNLWSMKMFEDNPTVEQTVMPSCEQAATEFQNWLTTDSVPSMSEITGELFTGLLNVITVVKNILIGTIVMVYFLNIRDTLSAQSKKIVYSLLKVKDANRLVSEVRLAHSVFGGFIIGKLLDSLITGIMCSFALQFLKMPHVFLVSVVIGVINVIPFSGPLIGVVPSVFLILLVSPMKCLYFLISIPVFQQFDGNIPGPKILGDSTGLPSFWVLFSILLFDGLFGFVGMIIAVPLLMVIYRLIAAYMSGTLKKKNSSARIEDHLSLDHIDEENRHYVDREREK